jgi:hypothetical protein
MTETERRARDDEDDDRSKERKKDEPESDSKLRPVPKKIGEGTDNLRRREEWFKRRSGGE